MQKNTIFWQVLIAGLILLQIQQSGRPVTFSMILIVILIGWLLPILENKALKGIIKLNLKLIEHSFRKKADRILGRDTKKPGS